MAKIIKNIIGFILAFTILIIFFIAIVKLIGFAYDSMGRETQCNFLKIEFGMPEVQVVKILGEPNFVEANKNALTMFFDVKDFDGILAEVTFDSGKVISKYCTKACSCP